MAAESPRLHIYGFIDGTVTYEPSVVGISPGQVTCVTDGTITAIVGPAGPEDSVGSRKELIAHTVVLEEALQNTDSVIPARFGMTVSHPTELVDDFLSSHRDRLRALLDEVRGHREFTLKAFWQGQSIFEAIISENPSIAELKSRIVGKSAEETHFDRISLGRAVAEALTLKAETLKVELSKVTRPRVLSLEELPIEANDVQAFGHAFRVMSDRDSDLIDAITVFDEKHGETLRLKLVGPSPLFHFLPDLTE